jgi:hypothetical protein
MRRSISVVFEHAPVSVSSGWPSIVTCFFTAALAEIGIINASDNRKAKYLIGWLAILFMISLLYEIIDRLSFQSDRFRENIYLSPKIAINIPMSIVCTFLSAAL